MTQPKKQARYNFLSYVSVDRHVATSGVETFEELCEAFGSSVEEEDKNEQEIGAELCQDLRNFTKS
jgi:predicted site-specific integrase-resolvase